MVSIRSVLPRWLLAASIPPLLAAGCSGGSAHPPGHARLTELLADFDCEGCNVVLLTVDTVRADHLPCYGNPRDTAPNICRFGEQNLLFANAYSPAPATIPAFRTIFGGGMVANEEAPDVLAHYEGRRFLAELMTDRGYVTAAFTDHRGLGSLDRQRGKTSDLQRGFEIFENFGGGRAAVNTAPKVTRAVTAWLDQEHSRPFLLWAHYFDPHFNYNPLAEDEDRFGFSAESCGRVRNGMDIQEIKDLQADLSPEELDCLIALHQAEIHATDREMGAVLDAIERLGLAPNTLVIVSADHGEEFMERARIGHERTVYNELIRVPLMIRHPRLRARERIRAELSTVAVFDIVLGATAGEPIVPEIGAMSRAHHYYGGRNEIGKVRSRPNEFTLISGNRKVIYTPRSETWEYYDLNVDPGERDNRWGDGAAQEHGARLLQWISDNTVESIEPSDEAREQFEKTNERLKGLGYVQ